MKKVTTQQSSTFVQEDTIKDFYLAKKVIEPGKKEGKDKVLKSHIDLKDSNKSFGQKSYRAWHTGKEK